MIARAREVGVQRMVTIGSSATERAAVTPLLDEPGIYTTAGLHPNSADQWTDELEVQIRERAAHPRCVAIGETGLDWYRDSAPRDVQREFFDRHIRLAQSLGLDVVAEGVETEEQRLILTELGYIRGQGYLFSRPRPEAELPDLLNRMLNGGPRQAS